MISFLQTYSQQLASTLQHQIKPKKMNKIALVTGGSRGLGKDMALSLAKKNIDVILTYNNNQTDAEEVVKTIEASGQKAVALKLDVGDIKSFESFLGQVSEVLQSKWQTSTFDFLINNAGIGGTVPIANMTEEIFDNFVNIHFKGVYFLTQKSLLMMNDGGAIIFLSSGTTRFCLPGYSVYSSLKSAVENFTKYVAKEYGNRGIRSNIVAPGPIETDFNGAAIRNNPQMKGFLSSQTALGRVGYADDIGSVVAFLCTEDAKWINGQRIEVSGGINL
ncbi:short-chain dehydrogenase [Emticicia aquatilis]|uniref:Short-chain dehydrogenase n=2 Tax=Emticicia aquatilis TaxID=1537369 RepID=A0A916Z4A7_9BACT|nr:short-chain dehydrogenase [Emticicia aquatilis]